MWFCLQWVSSFPSRDKPHDLSPMAAMWSTYPVTGVLCLGAALVEPPSLLSGESSHSLVATLVHHPCEQGQALN